MTEIHDAAVLSIVDTPKGHIMMDGQHRVFFRCKGDSCGHTAYLIEAENPSFEENRFEKVYYTDKNDWDWWEKEV